MNMKHDTLVTLELLEGLFDHKLKPIQEEISGLRRENAEIKHVMEHRVYKEMKEGFAEIYERLDRHEEISRAIMEDYEDHESRINEIERINSISHS